jgi:hypothetical protein
MIRLNWRDRFHQDVAHFRRHHEIVGQSLVIPTLRKQVVFSGMRKRQVTDIVAQSRESDDPSPIFELMSTRHIVFHEVMNVCGLCHYVEYQPRELHHAERMLKSFMGSSGKNREGRRKLVNMPKPLKGTRIHDSPLIAIESDEDVNWIAKFVIVFQTADPSDIFYPDGIIEPPSPRTDNLGARPQVFGC